MKRGREDGNLETEDIANCLMLVSRVGESTDVNRNSSTFVCKTCKRQFSSFQALGGHRASHKKPRLMAGDLFHRLSTSPSKPKTHECSICWLEFPMGRALGGHMRRHRTAVMSINEGVVIKHAALQPVMKKSSTSKRVLFLDLNLTPLQGDDLKLCSW